MEENVASLSLKLAMEKSAKLIMASSHTKWTQANLKVEARFSRQKMENAMRLEFTFIFMATKKNVLISASTLVKKM